MAAASCLGGDGRSPTEPVAATGQPSFLISDGTRPDGTAGFYFLPPMVSNPTFSGSFDDDIAAIDPVVAICEVTPTPDVACGSSAEGATPAVRTFDMNSTPPVAVEAEKYKVDWDTGEEGFVAGRTYRVHVFAGPARRELGFADVYLTTTPGQVKNTTNETIVLRDGRTLPIHFRIETGVVPRVGPARALELTGLPEALPSGSAASMTVTARDENGNVASGYRGTIVFSSSNESATLPAEYTFTESDAGTHTFTDAVSFLLAGSTTVGATDGDDETITGEASLTVTPQAASTLVLSGIPEQSVAGVAYDVTVTAKDQFGNVASGYGGTVQFSSTDPAATVPASYAFQPADAGVRSFPGGVTFATAGARTFQATDAATPPITASVSTEVAAGPASRLQFTVQPFGAIAGEAIAPPVVVTAYDAFANQASAFTGLVSVGIGTNPAGGMLSGTLQVAAVDGVATFSALAVDQAGSGYTLVASSPALTGATSDPFDIVAPTPVDVHWVNAAGGNWSVGSNWSTGTPPTAEQTALIDLPGTYTVTLDVNASVNSLSLGAASGVQTLTTASGRTLGFLTAANVLGSGRLTLNGGTVNGAGPLAIASGAVLTFILTSSVNAPVINAGMIAAGFNQFASVAALTGPLTTVAGSRLRVQSGGSNNTTVTVASGFTNHGTIELTKVLDQFGTSTLAVSSGTLVNATDGTITSAVGAGGGRVLAAQLDNQGSIHVLQPTTLNRAGSDHINAGTIVLTGGNLTISQTGITPSFTSSGTISVPAGRTLAVSGGSFTLAAGATLDGGGSVSLGSVNPAVFQTTLTVAALGLTNTVASFAEDFTTAVTTLSMVGSTFNGPGTLTNVAGRTITLSQTNIINALLVNAGTLASGVPPFFSSTTINAAFSTAPGSLIRVHAGGSNSATLTFANGFTNHGTIELTKANDTFGGAVLAVTNGTLVNAPDGVITSAVGTGGGRTLNAQLDNQGALNVLLRLTVTRTGAAHLNSGTIAVTGGDLVFTATNPAPSVTNSGTIDVGTGRTMFMSSGALSNAAGGSIAGAGTLDLQNTVAFNNAGSATPALARIRGPFTSTGNFAPATVEFSGGIATIPVGAGYAYTNVRVLSALTFAGSVTVAGNLTIPSGRLAIGAHTVTVDGDLATQGTGLLAMQTDAGVLAIGGNAAFGGASTNTQLTAGVLRVAGDVTQAGGHAAAFAASGSHLTVLHGTAAQTVSFATPGTATTQSHFQRLEIENSSAAGVTLASAVFANGQLRTPAGPTAARRIGSTAGQTLQAGGLDADGLVFDAVPLRVVNGDALARFDNAVFENMNPEATQFHLERQSDLVTFNNIAFQTVPTIGFYLHLVDTDLGAPLFTVTMQGTQPANHGGRIIESVAGQLQGWPF